MEFFESCIGLSSACTNLADVWLAFGFNEKRVKAMAILRNLRAVAHANESVCRALR
jgi:hypothetical protein